MNSCEWRRESDEMVTQIAGFFHFNGKSVFHLGNIAKLTKGASPVLPYFHKSIFGCFPLRTNSTWRRGFCFMHFVLKVASTPGWLSSK